jgi:SAM-dependent methyltransferase
MSYTDINSKTIDRWIEEGWEWGIPISHEIFTAAQNGSWDVVLTPVKPVPKDWFPVMKGTKLLGLASGGGQQMPIFTALGAECTVFDYSQKQLESERLVAEREGYQINIVRGDMSKPLPFEDNSFDMIFHPVSNCYIEDVMHVWRECFRILKSGGILMAGLDNGINFIFDDEEKNLCHSLPFNPLKDERIYKELMDNNDGIQFSHTLEEQIRGQLKAGFILKDLYEDTNGSGHLHEMGIPTFWATLVYKP